MWAISLFTASGSASGNGVAEGPAGGAGATESAEVAASTARRWTIASRVSVFGVIVKGSLSTVCERVLHRTPMLESGTK